jgi:hypothetical protein
MKDIFEKLSSYKIFNYLLPGAVYAFIVTEFYGIDLIKADIFTSAFLYYFLGMVINRIGSLIIEPVFKKLKIIKFEDYSKYILASQKDSNLEILSEINNTYRTFISLFFLVGLTSFYLYLRNKFVFFNDWGIVLVIVLLLILFILAYIRQTKYINNRIKTNLDE